MMNRACADIADLLKISRVRENKLSGFMTP